MLCSLLAHTRRKQTRARLHVQLTLWQPRHHTLPRSACHRRRCAWQQQGTTRWQRRARCSRQHQLLHACVTSHCSIASRDAGAWSGCCCRCAWAAPMHCCSQRRCGDEASTTHSGGQSKYTMHEQAANTHTMGCHDHTANATTHHLSRQCVAAGGTERNARQRVLFECRASSQPTSQAGRSQQSRHVQQPRHKCNCRPPCNPAGLHTSPSMRDLPRAESLGRLKQVCAGTN